METLIATLLLSYCVPCFGKEMTYRCQNTKAGQDTSRNRNTYIFSWGSKLQPKRWERERERELELEQGQQEKKGKVGEKGGERCAYEGHLKWMDRQTNKRLNGRMLHNTRVCPFPVLYFLLSPYYIFPNNIYRSSRRSSQLK